MHGAPIQHQRLTGETAGRDSMFDPEPHTRQSPGVGPSEAANEIDDSGSGRTTCGRSRFDEVRADQAGPMGQKKMRRAEEIQ